MNKTLPLTLAICLLLSASCVRNTAQLDNQVTYGSEDIQVHSRFEYIGQDKGRGISRAHDEPIRSTSLGVATDYFVNPDANGRVQEIFGVTKTYFRDKRWCFIKRTVNDEFSIFRLDDAKSREIGLIELAAEKQVELEDTYLVLFFGYHHSQTKLYYLVYGLADSEIPHGATIREAEQLVLEEAHKAFEFVQAPEKK